MHYVYIESYPVVHVSSVQVCAADCKDFMKYMLQFLEVFHIMCTLMASYTLTCKCVLNEWCTV